MIAGVYIYIRNAGGLGTSMFLDVTIIICYMHHSLLPINRATMTNIAYKIMYTIVHRVFSLFLKNTRNNFAGV